MRANVCLCGRSITDPGAFTRHQLLCDVYAAHQAAQIIRIREVNDTGPANAKRQRLARLSDESDDERPARRKLVRLNEISDDERIDCPVAANSNVMDTSEDNHIAVPDTVVTSHEDEEPLSSSGRAIRSNRGQLPARYRDFAPEPHTPLSPIANSSFACNEEHVDESPTVHRTTPNAFGVFREYRCKPPEVDPEADISLEDLQNMQRPSNNSEDSANRYGPYPNRSAYLLGSWYWNGNPNKTQSDLRDLVNNALLDTAFDAAELHGVNWTKIDRQLAGCVKGSTAPHPPSLDSSDGWREATVDIRVPLGKHIDPKTFTVKGLWYRPIEEVICTAFSSLQAKRFHYRPHNLFWQSPARPNAQPVSVHGELYTSEAFKEAYDDLQKKPPEPSCNLPRDIAACMLYSDSTHLAQFGTATLWPAYLSFGNQSKYERAKPNTFSQHHIAYFPKLPEEIQDFIHTHSGKEGSAALLAHCRRELIHAVWRVILGPAFVHACQHGVVVDCGDGVTRRIYPRLFTYSADYPEKVLLVSIRDMGSCPCPRCHMPKSEIHHLGQVQDQQFRVDNARQDDHARREKVQLARRFIYDLGYGITSKAVEDLLKPQSLVPTTNAFSDCLGDFIPNYYDLFVPDFLHEWELGVWKQILTHLIRILYAAKGGKVLEFNNRFRRVPVFGRDTIRSFASGNVSDLKKMAARNYEDILQCIIPVFQGLLPPHHDGIVQDLLWHTATLHALHKLRMHTEASLDIADRVLQDFANAVRKFKAITCQEYDTRELPREAAARQRRIARKHAAEIAATDRTPPLPDSDQASERVPPSDQGTIPDVRTSLNASESTGTRLAFPESQNMSLAASNLNTNGRTSPGIPLKPSASLTKPLALKKVFNMNTYKFHSLGDTVRTVRRVGTTDSYTSQWGEREHRTAKSRTLRTNMQGFGVAKQLAQIERREANIRTLKDTLTPPSLPQSPQVDKETQHDPIRPDEHHRISVSTKQAIYIPHWCQQNRHDPALMNFQHKLQVHILSRLDGNRSTSEDLDSIPRSDLDGVVIRNDRMYSHQIMQVNHTTYDMRREQDIIHIGTDRCDVMMLADNDDETAHPFWYARVLGIYHVEVHDLRQQSGPRLPPKQVIHFLYVRWFGEDIDWKGGWKTYRLDQVGFVPSTETGAFGFVDPADVIRGCHLIPAFTEQYTSDLLGPSNIARGEGSEHQDWDRYYVNRFVDQDMFMRYLGGGVGHSLHTPRHTRFMYPATQTTEGIVDEPTVNLNVNEEDGDDGCSVNEDYNSDSSVDACIET
ncbi:hypothetical protein K474DRAFT_1662200 [Panus rudis PR-1116 ss-1]|nr:hypothetical protein K474DRAFT_1662200 [Panus rudis PR-1116 ss-1]